MKSSSRLPPAVTGAARLFQLEVVTSVPFTRRPDAVRARQQLTQRQQRGLFQALLAVIAIGVATTVLVGWYLQRELPVAQKRAKESEALLAPPSKSFCKRVRPPMVCAHGGDTTHAPPNTVSAFRASLAAGADCVEVDAALSRDGVLVVMHVRELGQLLGRRGVQVGDLAAAEMLALRWASGEEVMSVEEAILLTSPFVSCVTLDVKTYNDKDGQPLDELAIAEALVGLVTSTRCTNCMIWAKSDRVVRRVLELSPGQRTGYIVMNETEESRQLGMQHPLRFSAGTELQQLGEDRQQRQRPAGEGWSYGGGEELPPGQQHQQPQGPAARGNLPRQPQPRGHMQPAVVGVHHAMVEPELLEALHGAGKQLFAWTVNQAEVLRAVLDVGVDALVTNYPLTALAAIDSRMAKCGSVGIVRMTNSTSSRPGGGAGGGFIATGDYL